MKTNKLSVLCLAGALLLTGVSFTSCLKGDEVDTNQYIRRNKFKCFRSVSCCTWRRIEILGKWYEPGDGCRSSGVCRYYRY